MRNFLLASLFILAVFTDSCATRHKDSDSSAQKNENQSGTSGTGVAEGAADAPPFVSSRPGIDPKTLGTPKMNLQDLESCQNKDGKADQVLTVEVQTENKSMDYFEVQMCPQGRKNCQTFSFATENTILHAPDAGVYEISIRACLDKIHSTDPENPCNAWSSAQNYTVKEDTGGGSKVLVAKELRIREQMDKVCGDLRNVMMKYNASVEETDPLRKMNEENLDAVGVNACSDMLLSNQFRAINMIANENVSNAPSASNQVATMPNTPIQIINQQAPAEKKKDPTSQFEGWAFIAVGGAGLLFSGIQVISAVYNATSEIQQRINREILQIQKKETELEYKINSVEIARLQNVENVLNNSNSWVDNDRMIPELKASLESDMRDRLKEITEVWDESWTKDGSKVIADPTTELKPFVDQADPEGLWNKIEEIHTRLRNYWTPKVTLSLILWKIDIGSKGDYSASRFQNLYNAVRNYDSIKKEEEFQAKFKAEHNITETDSKDRFERAAEIKKQRENLEKANGKLQKGWLTKIGLIAQASFLGGVKGGADWGLFGGRWGAFLGHWYGWGGGAMPLGELAAKAGFAYGAFKGTKDAFLQEFENLKGAEWKTKELKMFSMEGPEGVAARLKLGMILKADKLKKESSRGIFNEGYLHPNLSEVKSRVDAKFWAAIPGLLGMGASGVLIGMGEKSLSLASSEKQAALDQFLPAFSRLYQIAETLQIDSSNIQLQLLTGECRQ